MLNPSHDCIHFLPTAEQDDPLSKSAGGRSLPPEWYLSRVNDMGFAAAQPRLRCCCSHCAIRFSRYGRYISSNTAPRYHSGGFARLADPSGHSAALRHCWLTRSLESLAQKYVHPELIPIYRHSRSKTFLSISLLARLCIFLSRRSFLQVANRVTHGRGVGNTASGATDPHAVSTAALRG